jgi:hypothetical protein
MNPYSSASTSHSWNASLGNSKEHQKFWKWEGICSECCRPTLAPRDLFCSNFLHSRGSFKPCQNSWCSGCYKESGMLQFPRQLPENDLGAIWKKKREEDRFLTARRGDMLCAPFQCDICWFVNLKGRTPDVRCAQDRLNLALIRRVNLDVFWEKEPSTVKGIFWVSFKRHVKMRPI